MVPTLSPFFPVRKKKPYTPTLLHTPENDMSDSAHHFGCQRAVRFEPREEEGEEVHPVAHKWVPNPSRLHQRLERPQQRPQPLST